MIDVQVMTPRNMANISNVAADWSEQMLGLANVIGNAKIDYDQKKKQEELDSLLREYETYQSDPSSNAFAIAREKLNAKLLELQGSPFDSFGSQNPTEDGVQNPTEDGGMQ